MPLLSRSHLPTIINKCSKTTEDHKSHVRNALDFCFLCFFPSRFLTFLEFYTFFIIILCLISDLFNLELQEMSDFQFFPLRMPKLQNFCLQKLEAKIWIPMGKTARNKFLNIF